MKKFLKKIKEKEREGFTIVETLVAITILMIAIVGPMTIAQRGLMASIYARDQVTASYLAQDAMEYMINFRDQNAGTSGIFRTWLFGRDGQDDGVGGLAASCNPARPCTVETYLTGAVITRGVEEYYDLYAPATGVYVPNPVSSVTPSSTYFSLDPSSAGIAQVYKTIFDRRFYVDTSKVSNRNDEATFVIIVRWANGTIENEVRLQRQVFNMTL